MNQTVIVIGAGGHGRVVADIAACAGDTVLGFLDDNRSLPDEIIGFPYLGTTDQYVRYPDASFIVAIGDAEIRERLVKRMEGCRWYTAIHPSAVVSPRGAEIGEGSAVMANAVIGPEAKVGRHCIVNTAAVVEHNNVVGDFSHISVGAKLAGTVLVGRSVWVGIGATVINDVSICDRALIGAGAMVIRNITVPGKYIGVPAVRLER